MDLFSLPAQQLVDDAEGGIRYRPDFIGPEQARVLFETLHTRVSWTHHRRPMYDRVVDVPRLLASWRVEDIPEELPLTAVLTRVQQEAPAPYNTVGLNLYRDGNDSVAMHNDKLHTLLPGQPIALLSLGDARRMLIRAKSGDRESVSVTLQPGSLLTMSHASQLTHEHGIPKTRRPQGSRISVVFRVRPATWETEY